MQLNKNKKKVLKKYIYYNKTRNISPDYEGNLDLQSIAEWIACGFFLGDTNFTKTKYGQGKNYRCRANWYFEPKDISFNCAVDKFSYVFETLISKNIKNKKIILPLSGGLDSRTIASALRKIDNVVSYSYEFLGGVKETQYAKRISEEMGWPFFD